MGMGSVQSVMEPAKIRMCKVRLAMLSVALRRIAGSVAVAVNVKRAAEQVGLTIEEVKLTIKLKKD